MKRAWTCATCVQYNGPHNITVRFKADLTGLAIELPLTGGWRPCVCAARDRVEAVIGGDWGAGITVTYVLNNIGVLAQTGLNQTEPDACPFDTDTFFRPWARPRVGVGVVGGGWSVDPTPYESEAEEFNEDETALPGGLTDVTAEWNSGCSGPGVDSFAFDELANGDFAAGRGIEITLQLHNQGGVDACFAGKV